MSKRHDLKCWPSFFQAISDGSKKFEVRHNDRHFNVGDTLRLMEFTPGGSPEYSGREIDVTVTSVSFIREIPGLEHRGPFGYVIMSIELVDKPEDPRLLQMIKRAYDAGVCPAYQGIQCGAGRGKDCLRCWLDHLNARQDMPTCRECGCTDDRACDDGCSWVKPDLCSACAVLQENDAKPETTITTTGETTIDIPDSAVEKGHWFSVGQKGSEASDVR